MGPRPGVCSSHTCACCCDVCDFCCLQPTLPGPQGRIVLRIHGKRGWRGVGRNVYVGNLFRNKFWAVHRLTDLMRSAPAQQGSPMRRIVALQKTNLEQKDLKLAIDALADIVRRECILFWWSLLSSERHMWPYGAVSPHSKAADDS